MQNDTLAALLACVLASTLTAQSAAPDTAPAEIGLRYARFDPLRAVPEVPTTLRSTSSGRLWIVQFHGAPDTAARAAVTATGAAIHGYLPDNAYVVRMDAAAADRVQGLAAVRWAGAYHPAFRLEPELFVELTRGGEVGAQGSEAQRYNIVVVDKHRDKPALGRQVRAIGGIVDDEQEGSLLFTVTLTGRQLAKAAHFDEVLWIDRWTPLGLDMDNARIQGGANYIEAQGGFTGQGVNVHIFEGLEATHPDFTGGVTNVRSGGGAQTHGHATAGIVFGNGTSNPAVRGMAPDCTKFYTNNSTDTGSRYSIVDDLVNIHQVSHTTASWGSTTTWAYTSVSADADDIVFDHDIAWTQSQSNTGNRNSRPQAWAKNVFSIGGVRHGNNSNPADDSWGNGGSTGPAADGRFKPDLCAYYDGIGTSDRTAPNGYSDTNNWSSSFGGTSGATPIVAGHNVLAIQMFTDSVFGNALRNPGGSRHSNRPHFTTLKALQVASAAQYPFTPSSNTNRREMVGWGFPSLRRMWDYRNKTLIVDETDVLQQGDTTRWDITVAPGETELKVVLNYAEPAGNPAAVSALVNDLSLRVIAPDGTTYWGNHGLVAGTASLIGGNPDTVNPIECVFVPSPAAGTWYVDVTATRVVTDSHVETAAVDADYGLVVSGGTGLRGANQVLGSFTIFGQGCAGTTVASPICAEANAAGGTLSSGNGTSNLYAYTVFHEGTSQVTGFEIYTRSTTGGNVTVDAFLMAHQNSRPDPQQLGTTPITIGPSLQFHSVTFASPVTMTGEFYIAIDSSGGNIAISSLTTGEVGSGFFRGSAATNWSPSSAVDRPGYRVFCAGSSPFATPALGHEGIPSLGSAYSVTLSDAKAASLAIAMVGLSNQTHNGSALPQPLPGAPGCDVLVAPQFTSFLVTDVVGSASSTLTVPNTTNMLGLPVYHQWAIQDGANTLGFVTSDAGAGVVGNGR